jgi:hypothetical protein
MQEQYGFPTSTKHADVSTLSILFNPISALPRFTVVPQNVEIQPNTTAYLGCAGAGVPPPTLFWSKEGGHSVIFQGSGVDNVHVTEEGTLQVGKAIELSTPELSAFG